ncbi:hypothetical protein NP493_960g01026 [Ridgeia piscesae]|uniref:Uncharacterized protein n=1 Tax=Ridgeia piscesae TaxID=27915 RepID=A0AAD9KJR0_RIDPI|nr:hypothetical protein NP493_960g01026 [Ridgeia piscesae]
MFIFVFLLCTHCHSKFDLLVLLGNFHIILFLLLFVFACYDIFTKTQFLFHLRSFTFTFTFLHLLAFCHLHVQYRGCLSFLISRRCQYLCKRRYEESDRSVPTIRYVIRQTQLNLSSE